MVFTTRKIQIYGKLKILNSPVETYNYLLKFRLNHYGERGISPSLYPDQHKFLHHLHETIEANME